MDTSFTPVAYEYREILEEEKNKQKNGKLFFFNTKAELDCVEGQITNLAETPAGWFITINAETTLRIDRLITIYGKPGPAFDEYAAYGNSCLDCSGGYNL